MNHFRPQRVFFPEDKSSLRNWKFQNIFGNLTENLSWIFPEFLRFLKSREDFQQVENKYLEISKVWSYTEKILTKIIYAREAEQSIKDFYFDQVVELRQVVFLSFWLAETVLIGWPMSGMEKPLEDDHLIQIRLRLEEIFMNQISWDNLIPKVIIMPRLFGQICINL